MDLESGSWYNETGRYTDHYIFVVRTFDVATINNYFAPLPANSETMGKSSAKEVELRHNFKIGDYMPGIGQVFNIEGNCVYVFVEYSWGYGTFTDAKKACKDFKSGGYTDWRLPTVQELNFIYNNKKIYNWNDFSDYDYYWSSQTGKDGKPQYMYYGNGTWFSGTELTNARAIFVREFYF